MNVLSLFDGMSCGQIALDRVGIRPEKYYASEVDKFAMIVTQNNYPNTIQLGDINNYEEWELHEIDLLIGGSPCQDLSRIKSKDGKGLKGEKSKLFFKYVECIRKFKPKYFLLENVIMSQESNDKITEILGVKPIEINSGNFSAQDRRRLYWTNIPFNKNLPSSELVFNDIEDNDVDEKYYYVDKFEKFNGTETKIAGQLYKYYPNGKLKFYDIIGRVYNPQFKMATLTAVAGGHHEKKVFVDGRTRKLTPLEYERLQTVPDGYTSSVSNSQRYKMLGNGWTVDVIAHIFKGISEVTQTEVSGGETA